MECKYHSRSLPPLPFRVIPSSRLTPNETVARNVVLSSSYHRVLSRLCPAQRNRRPRPRPVLELPSVLAPFPSALCFPPSHLSVYLHLGLTSLHIAAIETTPPPCTIHCCWILFSTMKTREIPRVLPLPALTLCLSRRAIYTCPARLHFWLGDSRRLFRPTASHKAGPLIKTTPLLSHHSPLLANQEGLASKMEAAMGERAGLDRRSSHRTQQSGCECEFYVKFKFPQRSIT